jgi:hypothetical protein
MAKTAQGVLIPDALTMAKITRTDKNGHMYIGHDGRFGPLTSGAFVSGDGNFSELNHRRWQPGSLVGEIATVQLVSASEMEGRLVPQFFEDMVTIDLLEPVGEMITTSDGAMDLLDKVRIDIDQGLAEVPVLYTPLYERVNGPFPGGSVQIGGDVVFDANVVFFEKMEAGEIVFGTLAKAGVPSFVPISTYASGFEWTEDMIEYDRSYEISMNSRAFGRAYNYLLNHLHLSPLIAYTYLAANKTAGATGNGSLQANTLVTFQNAYKHAAVALPQRVPSWILANEADRFQIEDALLTPVIDSNGNPLRRVPVTGIIYYNGATVTNGVKSYVYPGVTAGKCYFIMPGLRMKELVHHDLRIDVGPADISRLIEGQQVARARRGLYLDIPNSVEEVTLPTS